MVEPREDRRPRLASTPGLPDGLPGQFPLFGRGSVILPNGIFEGQEATRDKLEGSLAIEYSAEILGSENQRPWMIAAGKSLCWISGRRGVVPA